MQMKALDDKMVETTDVRIDFRGNLNETRIKKPSSPDKKQSDQLGDSSERVIFAGAGFGKIPMSPAKKTSEQI